MFWRFCQVKLSHPKKRSVLRLFPALARKNAKTDPKAPSRGSSLVAIPAYSPPMPQDPFYASPAWRSVRAAVLTAQPRCAVPGCPAAARHVDHIVARAAGGAALDPANLRGLCHPHHSSKTVLGDGGFGRHSGANEGVMLVGLSNLQRPCRLGAPESMT